MTANLDRIEQEQYIQLQKMLDENHRQKRANISVYKGTPKTETQLQFIPINRGEMMTSSALERTPRRDEFQRSSSSRQGTSSAKRRTSASKRTRTTECEQIKTRSGAQRPKQAHSRAKGKHYAQSPKVDIKKAVILSTAGVLASLGIYVGANAPKDVVLPPETSCVDTYNSENPDVVTIIPSIEIEPAESVDSKNVQIEKLNEIFENNPEVKKAFDDVELALTRASKEVGQNIVDVIKQACDSYGGDMPVALPICVLEQESEGRMTNWKTGELLVGDANDTGFFQITPICEEDVNGRLSPDGVERCKEDPFDNVEIGVISLAHNYRTWDGDIPKVLSSYNAGASFVNKGNLVTRYVRECNDEHLAVLNQYPEIWDYILNRNYLTGEDDGIYHIAIDDNTGKPLYDFNQMPYDPYA